MLFWRLLPHVMPHAEGRPCPRPQPDGSAEQTTLVVAFIARCSSGMPYSSPAPILLKEYLPQGRHVGINELRVLTRLDRLPRNKWLVRAHNCSPPHAPQQVADATATAAGTPVCLCRQYSHLPAHHLAPSPGTPCPLLLLGTTLPHCMISKSDKETGGAEAG